MPDAIASIARANFAHDAAFATLTAVLKQVTPRNGDLARAVKTWLGSDAPLPEAPNMLPAVRLTPSRAGHESVALGVFESSVEVAIEVAVQAEGWRGLAGLTQAIVRRLRPPMESVAEAEVEAAFMAVDVMDVEILGVDVPTEQPGEPFARATVRIRLEMLLDD